MRQAARSNDQNEKRSVFSGIFSGLAHQTMEPVCVPSGTNPVRCTYSVARELIRDFSGKGVSHHARGGAFMWVIVAHCIQESIHFRIDLSSWSIYEVIA